MMLHQMRRSRSKELSNTLTAVRVMMVDMGCLLSEFLYLTDRYTKIHTTGRISHPFAKSASFLTVFELTRSIVEDLTSSWGDQNRFNVNLFHASN